MKQPEITETPLTSVQAIFRVFQELEFWLLLILTVGIFCTRPTSLSLRGEETRRGLIAREMLDSGDWLVPTQQGVPRLTKPPLHYWLVAGVGYLRGQVDMVAIRLPSILAVFFTAVMIYIYSRQFGARIFAFGSAITYVSMAQVVQIGRLGEMEALFTLLVSSSLFVWHWAFEQRRSPMMAWTAGYLLCGLAALAKGPQAPVYFIGGAALYLVLSRRFRALFSMAHLAGFLLAIAVVSAWVVPYVDKMGWPALNRIFVGEAAIRVNNPGLGAYLSHLIEFPLELLGCWLPWSPLLFAYMNKPFRDGLQTNAAAVRFSVICIAVALPTVWLPAGGRTRYLMPIYPLVAILIGAVVERISVAAAECALAKFWRNCVSIFAAACLVAGMALMGVYSLGLAPDITQSLAKTALTAAITVAVGAYLLIMVRRSHSNCILTSLVVVSAFWGWMFTGPVQDFIVQRSTDEATRIAQLRDDLDLRVPLWSLGQVHHFFAYHFEQPISVVDKSAGVGKIDVGDYFCFDRNHTQTPLPFSWDKVAEISCDRMQLRKPLVAVIVGRRTADKVAAQSKSLMEGGAGDDAKRQ